MGFWGSITYSIIILLVGLFIGSGWEKTDLELEIETLRKEVLKLKKEMINMDKEKDNSHKWG